jgi:sodium/potassium/calcium exchanger 3/sodium/potassium/calcium exchanger 4
VTESEELLDACNVITEGHLIPKELYTDAQLAQGAIAIHVFVSIYMFIGLAIICDEYFEPSLSAICEALEVSEDVAGATFMAVGSSAPGAHTVLPLNVTMTLQ